MIWVPRVSHIDCGYQLIIQAPQSCTCCDVWNAGQLGWPTTKLICRLADLGRSGDFHHPLLNHTVNPKILKVGGPKFTMDLSNVRQDPRHQMDLGRRDSRTHQRAAQGQARGLAETGRGYRPRNDRISHLGKRIFFFGKVFLGRDLWIVPRRVLIPLLVEMNQIEFLLNPEELQSDLATARSEDSRDKRGSFTGQFRPKS